jgi:hypothetical protein
MIEQGCDALLGCPSSRNAVTVSHGDGKLRVRLQATAHSGTCHSVGEEEVCEQIGCPLCSMIARI